MISTTSDDDALQAALAYPFAGPGLALTGPAGSGKTFALLSRVGVVSSAHPSSGILLCAPGEAGTARLGVLLDARGRAAGVRSRTLAEVALDIVRARDDGRRAAIELIDDVSAAGIFEDACTSLFSLEWPELAAAHIDPEVTGLRSPQRFAAAAYRLIRKLRAGLVSPEAFRTKGLRGATEFYGRPPNFSNSDLILATAQKYRDSLRVSDAELDRQRTREVDLVLILARLYEMYVATLAERNAATAGDAVYEAVLSVRAQPMLRERVDLAFAAVDDAQDLTAAQLGLLRAIFGDELRGVTLAGDVSQATCSFATGARGGDVFKATACTIAFSDRRRSNAAIERVALLGLDPLRQSVPAASDGSAAIVPYRADDARDEARFIAGEVARLVADGAEPGSIAIVTRHLHCAGGYIDALLARDVPVDVGGSIDLATFPAVLDALAALWAAADPFRHDFLLRNLEAPWLRLSDASIAILCGEASDPQPLLFELPDDDEDDEASSRRWDRRRDLRLGRNLTRGDVDGDLGTEARERIVAFRDARERWAALERTLRLGALARAILGETVLATLPDGARGRFEANLVTRLLARIDAFEARSPLATLHDFLLATDRADRLETAPPPLLRIDRNAVAVIDVEAAKGEEFDAVFVPDLHAGAWPRYYVPDAFLYMPSIGMIAKENVGDATSSRTAKFTYALHRYALRDKYNTEERRAFYTAATRARKRLFLSAAGRATRGLSTPEILSELEKAL